ncbi:MAG: RNA polymerase sigma factor [Vicinamibacterales bacterium]
MHVPASMTEDNHAGHKMCEQNVTQSLSRAYVGSRHLLCALASRYVGGDAEDVVQDVFVRALQNSDRFRHEAAATTWLYRITVNAGLSHCRRRRCRERADPLIRQPGTVPPVSVDAIALRSALATLAHDDRRICVLHDVMGFTHHEIATMLRIPPGTSKWKLTRARQRLYALAKHGGISPPPASPGAGDAAWHTGARHIASYRPAKRNGVTS